MITSLIFAALIHSTAPTYAKKNKKSDEQSTTLQIDNQEKPTNIVDVMPTFKGGDLHTFRQRWVLTNIKYPAAAFKKGVTGVVLLSFIVEKDGSISTVDVLKDPDKDLSAEAVRVVKSSPKWTPGKHNGKAVRVKYTMPVSFNLANKSNK